MNRRGVLAAGAVAMSGLGPGLLARAARAQSANRRVLRFVPQVALTSLDPIFDISAVTNVHAFYVFDTLYGFDSHLRPQPQMAQGHKVSDDGLVWDIQLRQGLTFHDGSVVRPADCIASLQRWAVKDVFGQLLAKAVDAWLAPDDTTLRLKLKYPFPFVLDALAKPIASPAIIMPERLAKAPPTTQVTEMIGSGPLRFLPDEFIAGARASYVRFDGYRPRAEPVDWFAGGKVVNFERVEWRVIPDDATASAALQAGEVDWWENVQPDNVPLLARNKDIIVQVSDPAGVMPLLRFNSLVAPFDRPEMRRAVLSAVRQSDYLLAMAGDARAFKTCHAMFPCGTVYGDLPMASPIIDEPDLDKARAAIKAADYKGERVVVLNPSDFPALAALGEVTFDLLKRLGFNAELAASDWGTLLKRRASQKPVEEGGWNIYHTYWESISIYSPATNVTIRGLGKSGYAGWYESTEMEDAFGRWLAGATEAARNAAAVEMQQIAFRDVPSIPLGQVFPRTAYRKSLTGLLQAPLPVPWGVRPAS